MNRADDELTEALNRRAEHFSANRAAALSAEQVIGRAAEIRRGRRMRASLVMAVVVAAVAIPLGITVLGDSGTTGHPGPATTPTPAADRTLSLGPLRAGAAPRTGYAYAGMLYPSKLPLGKGAAPIALARINGGYLVARPDATSGSEVVHFIGDDGTRLGVTWPIQGGFAVSPQGNVAAFAEPDGTVMAVQDAGSRYFAIGKIPAVDNSVSLTTVAVTGENCSGRSEADTCDIFVDDVGASQRTWLLGPHRAPHLDPSLVRTTDVSSLGTRAGFISSGDTGSCSAAQDAQGVAQWETCDYQLRAYSPDGGLVIGTPAYGDGLGDSSLTVLNARTGVPTRTLRAAAGTTIMSTQWEDNSHLLVGLFGDNRWAVLRVGLDGSREYALPVVAGNDSAFPYLLAVAN